MDSHFEDKIYAIAGSQAVKYWADRLGIPNTLRPNDIDYIVDANKDELYDIAYNIDSKKMRMEIRKNKLVYEGLGDNQNVDVISSRVYRNLNLQNQVGGYLHPIELLNIYQQMIDDDELFGDKLESAEQKVELLHEIINQMGQRGGKCSVCNKYKLSY